MSDSLMVAIDTIKKLTYLTGDQQQELYEDLVSEISLTETFLLHGDTSPEQYMENLSSPEQKQISKELCSDTLSERIQQSLTRILTVENAVEEFVYGEPEWDNDEWSEEWFGGTDDVDLTDPTNQVETERVEANEEQKEDDSEKEEEDLFLYSNTEEDKWLDEWGLLEEVTESESGILCVYSTQYCIFIVDTHGNDVGSIQRNRERKEVSQSNYASSEYERILKESQTISVDLSLTDDEFQQLRIFAKEYNCNVSLIIECTYMYPAQIELLERIQRGRQNITKNTAVEDRIPFVMRLNIQWNDIEREIKQYKFRKVQQGHQRTVFYKIKFHPTGNTEMTNIRIVGEQKHTLQSTIKIFPFQKEQVFVQSNWSLYMQSSDMRPFSGNMHWKYIQSHQTENSSCHRSFIQEVFPQIRQTPSIDREEYHIVFDRFLFDNPFELDNSTRDHTSAFSFGSQIRIETEQNSSSLDLYPNFF